MSNTNETNETTNANLILVLDAVGRSVLGERVESPDDKTISIKNPVILHVIPQDNQGRMSVQLLPIFFREFLADKSGDSVFHYKKSLVTESSIDAFDFRLHAQYAQMFNKNNSFAGAQPSQPQAQQGENTSVINLFDEK
jgi:hypothetical protein